MLNYIENIRSTFLVGKYYMKIYMLQFNVRSKEGIPYAYANNFFV